MKKPDIYPGFVLEISGVVFLFGSVVLDILGKRPLSTMCTLIGAMIYGVGLYRSINYIRSLTGNE